MMTVLFRPQSRKLLSLTGIIYFSSDILKFIFSKIKIQKMKIVVLWFKFHWILFLSTHLTCLRRQPITWANADISSIEPFGIKSTEPWLKMHMNFIKKCAWKCRQENSGHSVCLPPLTHRGPVDLRKWAIFNTILMSPKSWLSQEDLDAGCEHSMVPVDS